MDPRRDFATAVVRQLREAGHLAYFAGGCVRDALLQIEAHDYDVATDARPEQVRELFGNRRTLMIGVAFGVVCVLGNKARGEGQVEVATFRQDGGYSDGRHPDSVIFSSPEMDAQRRDFTINGLFFDPIENRVLDFVGGQRDLDQRVLRAIGEPSARFREDRLRMLRAIRFAARFDLEIDPITFAAIQEHAATMRSVSAERIATELRKTLVLPRRVWAWRKLGESTVLQYVLSLASQVWEAESDRNCASDLLGRIVEPDFPNALACVLWPLWRRSALNPQSLAETLARELKLSHDEIEQTTFSLRHAQSMISACDLPWSQVQPILNASLAAKGLSVARAIAQVCNLPSAGIEFCAERLLWPSTQLDPAPLIDGNQLKQLGLTPGPMFRKLIQEVRNKQLDGELSDREQAIQWIRQQVSA